MATKEQLKTWIVDNQDKQGKEGKDGQDFEKVKSKYLSLRGETSRAEADAKTDVKTGDYSLGAERARTAAQGLTFGFADEIEAGARSVFSERGYKDIRDEVRQNTNDYRTDNPGEALALEMAGGVVIPGGIARSAFKGATSAAKLAKAKKGMPLKEADRINKSISSNAVTLKQAAGTNAGLGGAYGLGASEAESLPGMAADTALGATLGGAVGSAIHGVGRQFRPLVNEYSTRLARKAVARDELFKKLGRDDLDPGWVTKGTAEGGYSDSFEKQLGNVFSFIKESKNSTLKGYNASMARKILAVSTKDLNAKDRITFKKQMNLAKDNEERSKIIEAAFNKNYDEAFKTLRFKSDDTYKGNLDEWLRKSLRNKTPEEKKYLQQSYDLLATRIKALKKNDFGKDNGRNVNEIIRELQASTTQTAKGIMNNVNRKLQVGDETKELQEIFLEAVGRTSPKALKLLSSTKAAYNLKLAFNKSAGDQSGLGIITPKKARKEFVDRGFNINGKNRNKAQATSNAGDGIAKEAAEFSLETIGKINPDSGTAGAIASTGSILGIGGLIGGGAILAPAVLGIITAVGLKAFQYSPMMLRRFNRMIAKKDYRNAADMLEKYGTGSGLVGTQINQLANELRQGR
jgi:hypothetical protein